jgi:hypothetical protein
MALACKEAGVLEFGVEADATPGLRLSRADELDDLGQRGDREEAVEADVGGSQLRDALAGAEGTQFGLAVRRPANSGWSATSVVVPISFSCRAMRTPSLVTTRSGSMKSAPCSIARS